MPKTKLSDVFEVGTMVRVHSVMAGNNGEIGRVAGIDSDSPEPVLVVFPSSEGQAWGYEPRDLVFVDEEDIPEGICPQCSCDLVDGVCRSCYPYVYGRKEEG